MEDMQILPLSNCSMGILASSLQLNYGHICLFSNKTRFHLKPFWALVATTSEGHKYGLTELFLVNMYIGVLHNVRLGLWAEILGTSAYSWY